MPAKKHTSIAMLCAIACLLTSGVEAGEMPRAPIAAYGEATSSCGTFVASGQNETQRYIYLAWLNGYLTGVNKYRPGVKIYNGMHDIKVGRDPEALLLWLENYCRQNPLDNLARAVFMLEAELLK